MKTAISILKYILFWMIIFTVQRLLFFIFHFTQIQEAPFTEQIWIFIKGLRLDLSMSGYFLLLPVLLLIIQLFVPKKSAGLDAFITVYTYILLVIVLLFGIIDLSIYKEWGAKLNSRAIEFLLFSPGEALASSTSSPIYLSAFIFISQLIVFIFLYRKYFRFECDPKLHFLLKFLSIPLYAFIAVLMMRGGLQLAPINQSAVYFSKYSIINHASLNTEWNLMHSVIENHFSNENPYVFMESAEAEHLVDSLYADVPADTVHLLNTTRPNIVYIILESFTSDVVEHFGGEKDVCPNLNRMAQEGVSFTNIYASGDRTDKGMIAILSSFPTQAVRTIIHQPDKFEKLPSIPRTLSKLGYTTSFFYGGESEFANFKSYLVSSGIEKIVDKRDFESSQMNSKWGAHDGFLFDKALTDLPKQKEPFISVLLTLSSHEPFEIPVPSPYKGDDLPSKFRKAAHYTDQCIADFIEGAKKQAWYKNTLFIIVADHGHRLPKEYEKAYDMRKFRIPLIMYGDVINKNYLHRNITKVGSQTDINATLFAQMNIKDTAYVWSSDLLNSKPGFAFYTYDNGIGWVDDKQWLTMDNVTRNITSKGGDSTLEQKRLTLGKAYMQEVFAKYLAY
jgi:phosphoglycerol transferase MdoB-like AlkP superfamily enzyme